MGIKGLEHRRYSLVGELLTVDILDIVALNQRSRHTQFLIGCQLGTLHLLGSRFQWQERCHQRQSRYKFSDHIP